MEFGIIIKNLVIIGAILGVAFLSQQPFSKINTKNYVYSSENKKDNNYLKSAQTWLQNNVLDRVSGEVGKSTASIDNAKEAITQEKNNVLENSVENTKKIIAQTVLNALGVTPEELGCPAK